MLKSSAYCCFCVGALVHIDCRLLQSPTILDDAMLFTLRSVLAGCVFGSLVAVINAYFGLKTGWGLGGGLIAAILGYWFFGRLRLSNPYTLSENVITATAASAASMMVPAIGVVSVLPALKMLGHELSYAGMFAWGFSVSFLGVFFAVPLRQQMIVKEQLRFPGGTVTAHTIKALHAQDGGESKKVTMLLFIALLSGAYVLLAHYFPVLSKPYAGALMTLSAFGARGFYFLVSPLLMGAGIVIGPRICVSLMLGAVLSWGLLGGVVQAHHWVLGGIDDYRKGIAGWLIWPGVGLLVAESIVGIVLQFVRALSCAPSLDLADDLGASIPRRWWVGGLCLGALLSMAVMKAYFHVSPYLTAIAVFLAGLLSYVAARALGETDINPLTAAGKVSQLLFGALSPGQVITNLMAGGVAAAGAASAGDMLQDWKTGYLLKISMRAQFVAQILATFVGVLVAVPIYRLFDKAYVIGGAEMPTKVAKI